MNQIQNKKTAISIVLVTLLGLLICFLIKEPYQYSLLTYFTKNDMSMPLSEYYVDFLLFNLSLKTITIFMIGVLGIGIYFLLFKTDSEIKLMFKVDSITTNIKSRFLQRTKSIYDKEPKTNQIGLNIPEESAEYNKFRKENNIALCIGIVFVFLLVFEYSTYYSNPNMVILLLILVFVKKLVGAILCRHLSKYNKGNSTLWTIVGFLTPSIALVVASCGIAYNKKSEILLNNYSNYK